MKSRALPADFDMTQALHAPFGTSAPVVAAAATSSRNFSPYSNTSGVRPLTLDTLRREPDHSPFSPQYTTPTNITPAIGGFGFTPPQSATDTISPGSAAGSMSALNVQHQNSPRYPFGGQFGQNAGYINYRPQMPRLQTHDRIARPMGETASSPLRASMSYTGPSSASGSQRQYHEGIQLHSEQALYGLGTARQSRGTTNPDVGSCGPYGLGFSCELHRPDFRTIATELMVKQTSKSRVMFPPSSTISIHRIRTHSKSFPSSENAEVVAT